MSLSTKTLCTSGTVTPFVTCSGSSQRMPVPVLQPVGVAPVSRAGRLVLLTLKSTCTSGVQPVPVHIVCGSRQPGESYSMRCSTTSRV